MPVKTQICQECQCSFVPTCKHQETLELCQVHYATWRTEEIRTKNHKIYDKLNSTRRK